MKTRKAGRAKTPTENRGAGKIHPIIIYPFAQPRAFKDLEALYSLVERLDAETETYARPLTVLDRKTHYSNERNREFLQFRREVVERHSTVLDAWCVDTCQMWYAGLGAALELGQPNDVYWLIPGDFNYGTPGGFQVLTRLHDLPEIIQDVNQDLCIGEIATGPGNSKQLIDTYGTFALLYNWFPREAAEVRQFTERPRSEFFAIRHEFLKEMLNQRWFAVEQTVVILLNAVFRQKRICRFFVGNITDLPEEGESLSSAMQQVERTETVLKFVWRERNEGRENWIDDYRRLETQSERVRRTALTILENLLR